MLKNCTVLLLLFAGNFACGADANWKTMNLTGGKVMSLAQDPNDSNTLLAAGAMSVYRSTNAAETWTKVLASVKPKDVAFAHNTAGLAYVASSYGEMFKTTDSGLTWNGYSVTATANGHTTYYIGFNIGLSVDPADDSILYAADNESYVTYEDSPTQYHPRAVYKSVDGGVTWTAIKVLDNDGSMVSAVIVPAHDKVCASLFKVNYSTGAIYCSADGGSTWISTTATTTGGVYALTYNPYNPSELYAGAYNSIGKSTDYGLTWNAIDVSGYITTNDTGNNKTIYTIVAKSTGDIVACNGSKCYESTDSGTSWNSGATMDSTYNISGGGISGNTGLEEGTLLYSQSDGTLYVADGNGGGIYKTSGSGFVSKNAGLYNVAFTGLLHDPVHANVIYATSFADFYVSEDSGVTWTSRLLNGYRVGTTDLYSGFAVDDTTGMLYAGLNRQLYKSSNFGANWNVVYDFSGSTPGNITNIGNIVTLAFDPKDATRNTMYMGTGLMDATSGSENAGLYKSTDKGASWSQLRIASSSSTVSAIAISSTTAGLMYVASFPDYIYNRDYEYVYTTTDGGSSWHQITDARLVGGEIESLQLDPDYDGTLYANNNYYLVRSTDAAHDWTTLYDGSNHGDLKKFLMTHPADGARAMYAGLDSSIYMNIAEDTPAWTMIGSGFNAVKTLAYGSVYAGTGEGLYKVSITASQVSTTTATVLISTMATGGTVNVLIPPTAFGNGVNVMVNPSTATGTATQYITPTSLGIDIETSISTQPSAAVTLTFHYTAADITGVTDETKLAIARLNDDGTFTVLASTQTPNQVIAATTHFSNYVLVQYKSAGTSAGIPMPIAYPMPFDPITQTQGMSIISLAADSQVKIYNILGQLIRKIDVPSSGTAVWDGRNDAGKTVASGVFIALVKDQAQNTQRLKIAVEK